MGWIRSVGALGVPVHIGDPAEPRVLDEPSLDVFVTVDDADRIVTSAGQLLGPKEGFEASGRLVRWVRAIPDSTY